MPKKKNQSKVNRVINFFKPTTPAKGMLLFAIVFAVLGGAYMLYKSQAASSLPFKQYADIGPTRSSDLMTSISPVNNLAVMSLFSGSKVYAATTEPYFYTYRFSTTNGAVKFKTDMKKSVSCLEKISYDVQVFGIDSSGYKWPVSVVKSAYANGDTDIMTFDQYVKKGSGYTYVLRVWNKGYKCNIFGNIWVDPTVDPDGNGY